MSHSTTFPIGVIGAGSFGTAIANLIALNNPVLLYARREEVVHQINTTRQHLGVEIHENITAISDLEQLADTCKVIFPIVPSDNFQPLMKELSPMLRPDHILIHGTKGFYVESKAAKLTDLKKITRRQVFTMSEVIKKETVVVRIGCLSGPNLASEIMAGQPTATVIASPFREVINIGKTVLASRKFQVFGGEDIVGAELAGAFKNIIALGSGILGGMNMGKNLQSLLITRGLTEMIHFGQAMGATPKAFLGTAGVGDLVCTATSEDSRNYTFGKRLGKGETLDEIMESMPELAEGVRTLFIAKHLADFYKLHAPISQMIYRVVYEDLDPELAIEGLMRYPNYVDVDYL